MFTQLNEGRPGEGSVNVYRGHTDETYTLQPSIFRNQDYRRRERDVLRELITLQPDEFRDDRTVVEQLVRMQHYGLPTRLLDFTYNPLVGLYFACSQTNAVDGQLVRITLRKSDVKYFDSDTVSCVANLSNLTAGQRNLIRRCRDPKALKNSDAGKRLLHFIRAEKPHFLPKIETSDLRGIFAFRPKQTNQRILAQQGGFFIFGLRSELQDDNELGIEIARFRVPKESKDTLLKELDEVNINPSTLFPEIESAAKYIMSKIPVRDAGTDEPD